MISRNIKLAFVRISKNGTVLGNGFLAHPHYIVTCAHVLYSNVSDINSNISNLETDFEVTFHWLSGQPKFDASAIKESIRYEKGIKDLVFLKLNVPKDFNVTPLRLATVERNEFDAELEPFVPVIDSSRNIKAKVEGVNENGCLILAPSDNSRQWIDAGVSGSAVLALSGELVEGMVIRDDVDVKQAFLLPAQFIQLVIDQVENISYNIKTHSGKNIEINDKIFDAINFSKNFNEETIFKRLLGSDPLVGLQSISNLKNLGPNNIGDILPLVKSRQHLIIIRKLCKSFGSEIVSPLINCIRNGDWNVKVRAAPCFSIFENGEADNDLYRLLKIMDFDVQRLTIEAIGYTGFSRYIRNDLINLAKFDDMHGSRTNIDRYSLGKLSSYVVEALGRGFSRSGDIAVLESLKDFCEFLDQNENIDIESLLRNSLRSISPAAADTIVKEWAFKGDYIFRRAAISALSRARLRRTALKIVPLIGDENTDLSVEAAICVGNVGDEVIAHAVADFIGNGENFPGAIFAVSLLYARYNDWGIDSKYISRMLDTDSEVSGQMLVSLAQTNPEFTVERALQGLSGMDPFFRGASAIALAWTRHKGTADLLRDAEFEASNELERLLVVTAQILAGNFKCGAALHSALQNVENLDELRPFWRYQILAALKLSELDERYLTCWSEIFGDDEPRFLSQIDQVARRAAT